MQSAIVLVNQLHRSVRPYDDKVVENLKFTFIVLRVIASFYAPAHEWVGTNYMAFDAT